VACHCERRDSSGWLDESVGFVREERSVSCRPGAEGAVMEVVVEGVLDCAVVLVVVFWWACWGTMRRDWWVRLALGWF
jgi:hypothetical protein